MLSAGHHCQTALANVAYALIRSDGHRQVVVVQDETPVKVADALDVRWYCSSAVQQKAVYRPIAIVMHWGSQADEGHYTAVCKSARTGQWCVCDDGQISPCSHVGRPSSQPYLVLLQLQK